MMLLGSVAMVEETVQLDNLITVRSADLVDDKIGVQEGTELVVGSVTELAGYFSTDLWATTRPIWTYASCCTAIRLSHGSASPI